MLFSSHALPEDNEFIWTMGQTNRPECREGQRPEAWRSFPADSAPAIPLAPAPAKR